MPRVISVSGTHFRDEPAKAICTVEGGKYYTFKEDSLRGLFEKILEIEEDLSEELSDPAPETKRSVGD